MPDTSDFAGARDIQASRTFTDSIGAEWTVWGIGAGSLPPKLRRLLGPSVEAKGTLLFVSDSTQWRALTPAPADWMMVDESKLESYNVYARPMRAD